MSQQLITATPVSDDKIAVWFDGGQCRVYTSEDLGISSAKLSAATATDGERLMFGSQEGPSAEDLLDMGKPVDFVNDEKQRLLKGLAEIRRAASFSQTKLGDAAGIRQSVISRIEGCEISPQINTLLKLLAPLGKTLAIVDLKDDE